jgi:hypothetical protein
MRTIPQFQLKLLLRTLPLLFLLSLLLFALSLSSTFPLAHFSESGNTALDALTAALTPLHAYDALLFSLPCVSHPSPYTYRASNAVLLAKVSLIALAMAVVVATGHLFGRRRCGHRVTALRKQQDVVIISRGTLLNK